MFTKENLVILRSAQLMMLEMQSSYARSLPDVPQSTKIGEFFGGFGQKHVQLERDILLTEIKLTETNIKLAIKLIDQLLPLL